jgi:hypothetical protein
VIDLKAVLKLLKAVLKLFDECPFGHYNGRLLVFRSTTEADLIAWLDRLEKLKTQIREKIS